MWKVTFKTFLNTGLGWSGFYYKEPLLFVTMDMNISLLTHFCDTKQEIIKTNSNVEIKCNE